MGAVQEQLTPLLKGQAFIERVQDICRYMPEPRLLKDIKYRRVLIPGLVGGEMQFALMGFIGQALRLRGAEVTGLSCDAFLPACTMKKVDHYESACQRWCYKNMIPLYEASGLPHRWYSEFISTEERAEFVRVAKHVEREQLKDFEFEGIQLGTHVDRSVQHYFRVGRMDPDNPEMVEMGRAYLAAAMCMALVGARVLDELAVEKIFMDDGQKIEWGVIRAVAHKKGIPVDILLGTVRGNHKIYIHERPGENGDPMEWWPAVRDQPLTPEQADELDSYFQGRATRPYGDRAWIAVEDGFEREEVREKIGLPAATNGLVFGVFPNVSFDAGTSAVNPSFETAAEWVVETIGFFVNHPRHHLVIKIHPSERTLDVLDPLVPIIQQQAGTLPANIHLLEAESPLTAHDVIEAIDIAMVYTSTVGIEAAYMGKPVINVGGGWHVGRGFSMDVQTPRDYEALLSKICSGDFVPPVMQEVARRYAYALFFRGVIPINHCSLQQPHISELKLERLDELVEGRDAAMDVICRGILRDEPFRMEAG